MRKGRVFVMRKSVDKDLAPPLALEANVTPRAPNVVETSEAAKNAVDREQTMYAHLPVDQEFSQENLSRALAGAPTEQNSAVFPKPPEIGYGKERPRAQPSGPAASSDGPPHDVYEARFPKLQPQAPIPRSRSEKRGRSPESSAGETTRGPQAPVIPKLQIPAGASPPGTHRSMPRYSPTGNTESSADQDDPSAGDYAMRDLPSPADIGQGAEVAYNSVDPDRETTGISLTSNAPIAEGAEPPVSAVGATSAGDDVLPTPRTAAAEALSELSLDSRRH